MNMCRVCDLVSAHLHVCVLRVYHEAGNELWGGGGS